MTDPDHFVADGEPISKQVRIICSAPGAVVVSSTAYQFFLPTCAQPHSPLKAQEPSTPRMA